MQMGRFTFAGALGAALCFGASPMSAQMPRIAVDPRAELMAIVFRLAGSPEYSQGRIQPYISDIDRHFAKVKDHPAVVLARQLRERQGVSFDAVMSMAVHLSDVERFDERAPFDSAGIALDGRWGGVEARPFLAALRRFVADARFADFVAAHRDMYDSTGARLQRTITENANLAWFAGFFGERPAAEFIVVPLLANATGNFGVRLRSGGRDVEIYAILGTGTADSSGIPTFDARLVPTLVHEFNHSFVNQVVDPYADALAATGGQVYAAVTPAMRAQAYGNSKTMIDESLVRAAVARYLLANRGEAAARDAIGTERGRMFLWTGELYDLLGEYEAGRARYPTFASFMPRVVEYFASLAPRVPEMVRRYDTERPKLVWISIENGAQDVDPSLGELTFRFDRPMRRGYSLEAIDNRRNMLPGVEGGGLDSTGRVFTLRVKLEPNHEYRFTLNRSWGGGFQDTAGVPLQQTEVRFRTRGAGAPRPTASPPERGAAHSSSRPPVGSSATPAAARSG